MWVLRTEPGPPQELRALNWEAISLTPVVVVVDDDVDALFVCVFIEAQ